MRQRLKHFIEQETSMDGELMDIDLDKNLIMKTIVVSPVNNNNNNNNS